MDETNSADRRGFLKCMLWAGTGVLWTVSGGVPRSTLWGAAEAAVPASHDFSFIQISDSHIGFSNAPNKDVTGTLTEAISHVQATKGAASLLIHTGDDGKGDNRAVPFFLALLSG